MVKHKISLINVFHRLFLFSKDRETSKERLQLLTNPREMICLLTGVCH